MFNLKIFEKFQKMRWMSYCLSTVLDTDTTIDTFLGISQPFRNAFLQRAYKIFLHTTYKKVDIPVATESIYFFLMSKQNFEKFKCYIRVPN